MNITLLPEYEKTPKRGAQSRKKLREPNLLLSYAIENGGRVELAKAMPELLSRGFREGRIPHAIFSLKKYYGLDITTERQGRRASAYVINLSSNA